MKQIVICMVTVILFASCEQRPKIDYEAKIDTTSVVDDRVRDTTKVLVSELPIKFDSTDILIYAIGLVDVQGRNGYSKIGSGSYGSSDGGSSYFNRDQLTGSFINLVFQDKKGGEIKLTDKKMV